MMNDEQRRAIEWECARLINSYANLSDEARWREVCDLFTRDGVLVPALGPRQTIKGREALLKTFLARPRVATRHVCSNIVVSVENEGWASASSLIERFDACNGAGQGSGAPPVRAEFDDQFTLEDGAWRFAERRGTLLVAAA
jgi:hypothetical protein